MLYYVLTRKVLYCVLYVALATIIFLILDMAYLLVRVKPISVSGLLVSIGISWITLAVMTSARWLLQKYNAKRK